MNEVQATLEPTMCLKPPTDISQTIREETRKKIMPSIAWHIKSNTINFSLKRRQNKSKGIRS